jgi:hypothetical protein
MLHIFLVASKRSPSVDAKREIKGYGNRNESFIMRLKNNNSALFSFFLISAIKITEQEGKLNNKKQHLVI